MGKEEQKGLYQRLEPVQQARTGMVIEYLSLGDIDRFIHGSCKTLLNTREARHIEDLLDILTRTLQEHPEQKEEGKKAFVTFALAYEFIGTPFELALEGRYERFKKVIGRKPYEVKDDKPIFFYRGNPEELQEMGIPAQTMTGEKERFEGPIVLVRDRVKKRLEERMNDIRTRTQGNNPVLTDEDYYQAFSIMVAANPILGLEIKSTEHQKTWKTLETHFGPLAIEIPQYFYTEEESKS